MNPVYTPLDRPESIPTVFVEAWNRRDPDTLADLFEADADFVNVVGIWWHDREAIRKAHAYGLTRIFQHSTLRLGRVKVRPLTDAIAVVHARMTLSGQTAAEGVAAPGTRRNLFSFVVHRTAQGWRSVSAHNTDIVPGKETQLVDAGGSLRPVDYRRG